ncbi:putative membrane protein [Psychrobacter sp. JCM 18902]|nr:putative membrane protein [Psychrobacter sp. JCM 18902]
MTIVLGIVGALLGGFLAGLIGINADGGFTGLIFSVIGAIILLFIYEMIMSKRGV